MWARRYPNPESGRIILNEVAIRTGAVRELSFAIRTGVHVFL